MNLCNIKKAFEDYVIRKWDTLYILLDVHGTVIPSGLHHKREFKFISDDAIEVLQWFSKRKEIKIILWTSSYPTEIAAIIEWLNNYSIHISFVNCNPECKNTSRAEFRHKPYFNILIDDRAGFNPIADWAAIKTELKSIGEWDKNI